MEAGRSTRFRSKYPRPSVGDRFGELTVLGFVNGPDGGLLSVRVQCSCGDEPHSVDIHNLRKGASTRCNACAMRVSCAKRRAYTKAFYGYDDIVPDLQHRRRLLNRIGACINRCTNPKDAGWPNYGGRGIRVSWGRDKRAFLAYLVTLPGWDDPSLELDRADTDRGYEPGNLRFITKRANIRNRRQVQDLQRRLDDLERRLRYCTCGGPGALHDYFE